MLVTGVATNLGVEQTARHGTDLGLTVHPVSDCVAADREQGSVGFVAGPGVRFGSPGEIYVPFG
jgi:biuret amidohydrolase